MSPPPPGLHLLHKPVGATSFATLNGFVGEPGSPDRPRACHGGTLDPFAEGLLLALVGWCTHLFEPLHALPKTYVAEVVWGVETDNGDPTGRPLGPGGTAVGAAALGGADRDVSPPALPDPAHLDPALLEDALAATLGWTEQVPPATSAKKLGGEPAYKKAHRGEVVELPPSRVWLHAARWLGHSPGRSRVELVCGGGFYVRAWARDLGRALGVGAHLGALRREAIGPWRLADVPPGGAAARRGLDAVRWLPRVALDDAAWGRLRAGGELTVGSGGITPAPWSPPPGWPLPPRAVVGLHLGQPVALLGAGGGARPGRGVAEPLGPGETTLRATSTWRRDRAG